MSALKKETVLSMYLASMYKSRACGFLYLVMTGNIPVFFKHRWLKVLIRINRLKQFLSSPLIISWDPRESFMFLGRDGLQCSVFFMVVSSVDPSLQKLQSVCEAVAGLFH